MITYNVNVTHKGDQIVNISLTNLQTGELISNVYQVQVEANPGNISAVGEGTQAFSSATVVYWKDGTKFEGLVDRIFYLDEAIAKTPVMEVNSPQTGVKYLERTWE